MANGDNHAALNAVFRTNPKKIIGPQNSKSAAFRMGALACGAAALIGGAAFFFPNGGEWTIDANSREGVESDLRQMSEGLSATEKQIFLAGVMNIAIDRFPPSAGTAGLIRLGLFDAAMDAAPQTLNGVTRDEIMAVGRLMLERQATQQASEAAEEAREAAEQASEDAAKNSLRTCIGTHVTISNMRLEPGDFGPTLRLDVTNNLPWVISGAIADYEITSVGRSVPWHTDRAVNSFAGGLEPGETRTLSETIYGFPTNAPEQLNVAASITDVADAQQRQLVRDVRVIDWADGLSDALCPME